MNLQRIQYFLVLCESFHFTNAARKLGISQPALTKSIYQLEKDLGVRLIRREGRHTHLTKQGAVIRDKYTELVAAVGKIETEISNAITDESKSLKLAVTRSVDFSKFVVFLAHYHERCSDVQLDIVDCDEDECESLLLNGEVDFSLTFTRSSKNDQVLFLQAFKDELGVMAPSGVDELEYQNTVLNAKQRLNKYPSKAFRKARLFDVADNRPVVNVDQELWAQQLIQAGLGVGLISSSKVDMVKSAGVRWQTLQRRQIYVSLIAGRFDSAAYTNFVDLLKNFDWETGSQVVGLEDKLGRSSNKIPVDV